MKSSFCIDLQRFMLIPTKFPLSHNTIVSLVEVPKFEKGQLVKVIDGAFKGVIGRVARWQGQQRVGVVVDELVTVVTAYIPSAFLMSI